MVELNCEIHIAHNLKIKLLNICYVICPLYFILLFNFNNRTKGENFSPQKGISSEQILHLVIN